MTHLILSPHPDDAVLSCGGLMAQLAQAGEHVVVYTAMAGAMPPDVVISPFIEELLVRWELGPDPVPGRRVEDRRAAAHLDAEVIFGPFPDAVYRTDGHGTALYPDLARLFGTPHPDDPVLCDPGAMTAYVTARMTAGDTLYIPLGAGGHVDHRLVRDVVLGQVADLREVAVFLYEEYPYSADGDVVIDTARTAVGRPLMPVVHPIGEAALAAKIAAIACHTSQISSFWRDVEAMAAAVRAYAWQVGLGTYAERLWRFA